MRISYWSSDVCSSDLREESQALLPPEMEPVRLIGIRLLRHGPIVDRRHGAAGHQALDALAERGLLDLLEQDRERAPAPVLALDLAGSTGTLCGAGLGDLRLARLGHIGDYRSAVHTLG